MASAIAPRKGAATTSATDANVRSTDRFSSRELRPSRIGGRVTTGIPSTSSSMACDVKISKNRGTIEMCTSERRTVRRRSRVSSWLPTEDAIRTRSTSNSSTMRATSVGDPSTGAGSGSGESPSRNPITTSPYSGCAAIFRWTSLASSELPTISVRRGVISRGRIQLRIEPRTTGTSTSAATMKSAASTAAYTHQSRKNARPCDRSR